MTVLALCLLATGANSLLSGGPRRSAAPTRRTAVKTNDVVSPSKDLLIEAQPLEKPAAPPVPRADGAPSLPLDSKAHARIEWSAPQRIESARDEWCHAAHFLRHRRERVYTPRAPGVACLKSTLGGAAPKGFRFADARGTFPRSGVLT
eukprot:CAMPEP_0184189226 /NCGR_PEP_ID=MMETSP0976-20121227/1849_1 /TAXON_ID=483370 /ORGANISM="non described non described, Strain CCMP2097" /LENGTH=147 /DNA_ID=CAMNT_0026493581 /DNA_START=63 /DNA_END=502 /DNA_ORIENTATION=-